MYLKRLQQQKEGQDGVHLEMNLDKNRSELEVDDLCGTGFSDHQMSTLKKSEREKEINQGTIVDRIDYNIQIVAASAEHGFTQLQKAERTQKRGYGNVCHSTRDYVFHHAGPLDHHKR